LIGFAPPRMGVTRIDLNDNPSTIDGNTRTGAQESVSEGVEEAGQEHCNRDQHAQPIQPMLALARMSGHVSDSIQFIEFSIPMV